MNVMTKDDVLEMMKGTGLVDNIGKLHTAIIGKVLTHLTANVNDAKANPNDPNSLKESNRHLLNSVGPAAAATAVQYAVEQSKRNDAFKTVTFNGSYVNNVQIAEKNSSYSVFSTNLREYLLPRFGNASFDSMIDPRHLVDMECGYPGNILPIMYRYMYDRDDIARRVNDIYPDESCAVDPELYDVEDEGIESPWEKDLKDLFLDHNILQMIYRWDKLMGLGHFGCMLIALEGETDLSKPIDEPDLIAGVARSYAKKQRKLLYLRPFDEYLAFIQEFETNPNHPRAGMANYYNLSFTDLASSGSGAAVASRKIERVHWSRICHAGENYETSRTHATPRLRPVFNRLLDLRKLKGASAEMFWKGGFPGISFEVNPQYLADNPEYDVAELKDQVKRFSDSLQRYFVGLGVSAKALQIQISDPKSHVFIQMQAIAAHYGIPLRIFLGSEEGRLASGQDKATWNQRLKRRLRTTVEPELFRNLVDRFHAIGVLRPPADKRYFISWPDLNSPSDEDRANLSLKWTQALSQYVTTGIIHLIPPMDYLTVILGLVPSKAKQIISTVESKGGFAKLLKVDPSQTAAKPGGSKGSLTSSKNNGNQAKKKRKSDSK